jgi:hypothetical protein
MKWYSATVFAIGIAFSVALALFPKTAPATWKPEYAQNAPEINQWYKDQQMNTATWERLGSPSWKGCCEKGDVFKTRFRVGQGQHGDDEWWYFKDGVWNKYRPIPSTGGSTLPTANPPSSFTGPGRSCASIRPRKESDPLSADFLPALHLAASL